MQKISYCKYFSMTTEFAVKMKNRGRILLVPLIKCTRPQVSARKSAGSEQGACFQDTARARPCGLVLKHPVSNSPENRPLAPNRLVPDLMVEIQNQGKTAAICS